MKFISLIKERRVLVCKWGWIKFLEKSNPIQFSSELKWRGEQCCWNDCNREFRTKQQEWQQPKLKMKNIQHRHIHILGVPIRNSRNKKNSENNFNKPSLIFTSLTISTHLYSFWFISPFVIYIILGHPFYTMSSIFIHQSVRSLNKLSIKKDSNLIFPTCSSM